MKLHDLHEEGLVAQLSNLKPDMAMAIQEVLNDWQPNEEGWDEELGYGGACDLISDAISDVIARKIDVEFHEGGHEGDCHAYIVVDDGRDAAAVDLPPHIYEVGSGYSWEKIPDVKIESDDITVIPLDIRDIRGS